MTAGPLDMSRWGGLACNKCHGLLDHVCCAQPRHHEDAWALFPHRHFHEQTWTVPGSHFRSQIDYVLISNKWRSALYNTGETR
ncbi:unnamed protein product [Soboliphyme baturini]|uniref:Uncharacterized protein n=1 Tax=Soboliphyme baturini TaxID=241478 RepID=A0A183IZ65_9BILA|nr:unnamed protein product [Soboliphyme baturini]